MTNTTGLTRRMFFRKSGKSAIGATAALVGFNTGSGTRFARAASPVTLTVLLPTHWKLTEGIASKDPSTVPPQRLWYYERIMQWEKDHPEIKLDHQSVNWEQIAPKFIAASLAGNPTDIVLVDGNELPALVSGGFLLPLDGFRYGEWDDFSKDVINFCTINGRIYGMPVYLNVQLYFANLKLLQASGIKAMAQTWPEVIQQGKSLTKDTRGQGRPDQWGIGLSLSPGPGVEVGAGALSSIVWSQGGRVADAEGRGLINTPEMARAVQLVVDLINRDKVMSRDVLNTRAGDQTDLMTSERWATGLFGSSLYPRVAAKLGKENVGLGALPIFPGGKPYGLAEVQLSAISAKTGQDTNKRDAAFELLKHLGANETLWATAKYQFGMPTRRSAVSNPVYTQDPALKFLSQYTVDHARPMPHIRDVRFFFDGLVSGLATAVLGRGSVQSALEEAQRKYDERIKRS